MREEVIISGRMNPMIDPQLNIWHWHIPLYLFLGGLAAGILFFAALYTIQGKEKLYPAAVKRAPFITPFILVIGLLALLLDLNNKPYFWQLYTTLRLESPMSWGAWTLMVVTPISFIWCALNIREIFPSFDWKYGWLKWLETFFIKYKIAMSWVLLIFSVILGIYTGILFSAFNARPLWNTSILGPLFLASGLSTGAAYIMLVSRSHAERIMFSKIDIVLIGIELFLIIHMFMGFLASTQVQIDAASLFLGGPYTAIFWVFVVFLGMILPAILEVLELNKFRVPVLVPGLLVLFGGLMFRFVIAYAGQASRWLY
ncbi:MAG: nitrite reductase [Marinilabiliales bacterium]|nr:MAG: nitrite reductase [Marinilabiliales bacterium]